MSSPSTPAAGPDGPFRGFPPVWHPRCRVLVLGTFPGPRSLAEEGYYAHPQNAFWDVIGSLCGFDPRHVTRRERLEQMLSRDVALWDVLERCRRQGSEDSRIVDPVPNDFAAFLPELADLRAILFNGRPAWVLWRRLVTPSLPGPVPPCLVMPSTSPAAARLPRAQKVQTWVEVLRSLLG
ncbi:MAG TPA: DNA-deoxyinosine glycosylase [Myxococcota bacterium]|mgnify:CR=1 FL=1|nr:DNA-deoxyinosine glycosylase [Myxococcota bacterium]HQK50338.1 DNA-deoxyinosine glycosylase [Myxococcota bacterium]